jgi:hypothetical protein
MKLFRGENKTAVKEEIDLHQPPSSQAFISNVSNVGFAPQPNL